ncbi:MAG: hypothetical protein COB67_03665 [SAR324 cluster bacterium]|uniref:Uncharacterized protein n=1 Tax=SAR324 cluster bacterium TaxID=2024889 RepID=A0A2A4T7P8_9DELT|nr:MAG: hypothetical protein COB67_03665 [SAR324 cluster bacterium]
MKKNRLKQKWHYRVDNFFSQGGASIFWVLLTLFFFILLFMGGLRILINYLPRILPDRQELFALSEADQLITLAENEH